MIDLKTTMTLVFEAPKDQTARTARSDGEHFEVLRRPRQIAVSLASPHSKNLGERYTLGTLSCIAVDVAAGGTASFKLPHHNLVLSFTVQMQFLDATLTRITLTFEDNNTVGANAMHTPALILVVLAGKKKQRARNLEAKSWPVRNPARICSTHILLNSWSARRMSCRNGLRTNPAEPSAHSEATADESLICGINGPLAHHFTIVAIVPPCITEVILNTPSQFTLTLHDDENKTAKYGNFERCKQQEVGYRLCQKGMRVWQRLVRLLGLDVTSNTGADGVIPGGFG
ncbi:hypothetical protein ARMSODRAFT_1071308 [Armillaria solidipes]|uniref:Uncharacterized protein n=1 Tax=Armillaria solidipes TaxID=1076256 RepID=A0A2H3APM9_9AGAR|nr:hypothetical protein ARMSODRAFT_1071308 [Armillaria solidipes]